MSEKECTHCTRNASENVSDIPYVVHESITSRLSKIIKWQWIALVVIIVSFLGYIVWSQYCDSQYDKVSYDYSQDGIGINIIGENNEVTSESEIAH